MRINLEEPYATVYRYGDLRINKTSGRKQLILFDHHGNRLTTSYSRYLMAVKLGTFISPEFDVDHIDEDKTNDSLDNLQLLTQEEHRAKTIAYRKANIYEYIDLICSSCNKPFRLRKGQFTARTIKTGRRTDQYYCSISCKMTIFGIDDETIQTIQRLDHPENTSISIAKLLNISPTTIIKYRKNIPQSGGGIKITNETIDKINSFDPNRYTVKDIAKILNIGLSSVIKYQTKVKTEGHSRTIPEETFKEIDQLSKTITNKKQIAKMVNVSPGVVYRYLDKK